MNTESLLNRLYRLKERLRLLARADIRLSSDGHRLSGEIHQEVEAARLQLNEFIDQLQDGHLLNDLQRRHIAFCQELVETNRPLVRQLELAFL